jgi:hypothetical protein
MALIAGLDGRAGLVENNIDRALAAVQAYEAPLKALAAAKRVKGGGLACCWPNSAPRASS